jgi:hypothetical protein
VPCLSAGEIENVLKQSPIFLVLLEPWLTILQSNFRRRPPCFGCEKPVTSGAAVELAGRLYHVECGPSCVDCAVRIAEHMAAGPGRNVSGFGGGCFLGGEG